jgi:hypothetical protein
VQVVATSRFEVRAIVLRCWGSQAIVQQYNTAQFSRPSCHSL